MAFDFYASQQEIQIPVMLETNIELEHLTIETVAKVEKTSKLTKKQNQPDSSLDSKTLQMANLHGQPLKQLVNNSQSQTLINSSNDKPTNENMQNPINSDTNKIQNTLSSGVELPSSKAEYLNNPKPRYPTASLRLEEQGRVVIHVFIGKDGVPQKIEIGTSSGYTRLDRAALEAIKEWRFVPGTRAGLPEAMWLDVPLVFKIN